nr:MAG TPA: hypothetical protein [Caudoviricetes sp.]
MGTIIQSLLSKRAMAGPAMIWMGANPGGQRTALCGASR